MPPSSRGGVRRYRRHFLMPRTPRHVPLNVFPNSRLVGRLSRQPSGAIDLRYDPSWLAWEYALPVSLSLPLREDRYSGAPVIAVFDNLLPDNDEVRRRMAARVRAQGVDTYSLLAAVGRDCVGALQFLPDRQEPGAAGLVEGRPVDDDEISRILDNLASAPLGMGEDEEFRISIAGGQEKTALLRWNGPWHVPHGTAATTHILTEAPYRTSVKRHRSVIERRGRILLSEAAGCARHSHCSCHDRRIRREERAARRALRPPLEERWPSLAATAGGPLPSPLLSSHAQILRRRPKRESGLSPCIPCSQTCMRGQLRRPSGSLARFPADLPKSVSKSIVAGFRRRLRLLELASTR